MGFGFSPLASQGDDSVEGGRLGVGSGRPARGPPLPPSVVLPFLPHTLRPPHPLRRRTGGALVGSGGGLGEVEVGLPNEARGIN